MTDHMTQADLDAIRARSEAATPGPWCCVDKGNSVPSHAIKTVAFVGEPSINICCGISPKTDNAAFIAHARTDIPALLAEVERLNDELRILRPVELQGDAVTSFILAAENSRLTTALDAAMRRAEAAEADLDAAKQDIRDMLYEASLLVDDALCLWCEKYSEPHNLCWAQDCKTECKWRGPCAENRRKEK